ncbi:hypothetical protein BS17DRAFT_778179 [Gyrodon lividus]|nr:hypothetical protein BS17DRAFT_778179 [Gyrodon lividus]
MGFVLLVLGLAALAPIHLLALARLFPASKRFSRGALMPSPLLRAYLRMRTCTCSTLPMLHGLVNEIPFSQPFCQFHAPS